MSGLRASKSAPLDGIRVLDLTVAWAGPYAAMLLADLGAEVIRVENIHVFPSLTRGMQPRPSREFIRSQIAQVGGYPGREPGMRPWNRSPFFNAHARNKRSVTIDLRREQGKSLLEKLVALSDGVIENNAPDTLEKLGITWEWLRGLNKDLIFLRMPAFGLTGPYASYRALGTHLEAFLGQTVLRRYPDMDPSMNSTTFSTDFLGGATAAGAFVMALLARQQTREGRMVEVAQAECGLALLADAIIERSATGAEPEAVGNGDRGAIQGCYKCRGNDRWLVLRVECPEDWAKLREVVASPDLSEIEYARAVADPDARRHVERVLARWALSADPRRLALRLQQAGVAAAPVLDHEMAFADPHLRTRGFFVRLENADCGSYLYPGAVWKSLTRPVDFWRGPVQLGEDNRYVLCELLGVGEDEYQELVRVGLIGTDFVV